MFVSPTNPFHEGRYLMVLFIEELEERVAPAGYIPSGS
jgi:hypothetical protein